AQRLQPFLQQRLGILALAARIHLRKQLLVQAGDDVTGRLEAAIDVYGPEDRLQRVGQYGWTPEAAALELAFAQPEIIRQGQLVGDVRQCRLTNEAGSHTRQVAFLRQRKTLKQQRGHHEIQHRIAKELQAFVVIAVMTAMREGLD